MSYTVRIARGIPAATVAKIQDYLELVARTDVNFNGATFDVVRDDFTSIDEESYDTARVYHGIQRIIAGEDVA